MRCFAGFIKPFWNNPAFCSSSLARCSVTLSFSAHSVIRYRSALAASSSIVGRDDSMSSNVGGHLEDDGRGEWRVAVNIDPIVDIVTTQLCNALMDTRRNLDESTTLRVGGSGQLGFITAGPFVNLLRLRK